MARRVFAFVLAALWLTAGCVRAADGPEKAGEAAALAWLATVDAGQYGKSWDEAASAFKAELSRGNWEAALEKARRPLGNVVSRKLRGAKFLTSLPNGTTGEFVVIQYDASFEKAPAAVETITPMKDKDGVWRVSGYFIK